MSPTTQSFWLRKRTIAVLLIAVLAGGLAGIVWLSESSTSVLLEQARGAFSRGDAAAAEDFCKRVLASEPRSAEALLLAGKSALQLRRLEDASGYLDQHPGLETDRDRALEGRQLAGEVALQLGQASKAETSFRRVLSRSPRFLPANVRMAYLLGFEGRCWEAAPFLMESVRQAEFTQHHLILLGASEPVISDPALLENCRRSVPGDPLPLIGLARTSFQQNDLARAESLLREVVAGAPNSVEGHASLGRVLAAAKPDLLSDWQRQLPIAAEAHPDVWSVRGAWADHRAESRAAVRCYAEAVRRDPNHRVANYRLGQLLVALNGPRWLTE